MHPSLPLSWSSSWAWCRSLKEGTGEREETEIFDFTERNSDEEIHKRSRAEELTAAKFVGAVETVFESITFWVGLAQALPIGTFVRGRRAAFEV